jgi:hypothetical protein
MCGAAYMRHQLITKESGLLACTGANGCAKGRDAGQLSSGDPSGHGRADSNTLPVIHRTTAADILRYNDEDVT